jgi:guanosine-3',5'-bis(diphosphate) 3'-pyrophosphohydrolase
LKQTGHKSLDRLLEEIGLGNRVAFLTARSLLESSVEKDVSPKSTQTPLVIAGTEGMLVSFAKCCYPIPGDHIIGHIRAGRGLAVHRNTCIDIADVRENQQKCIDLQWADEVQGEFAVEIRVLMENRRGIFANIANQIHAAEANIEEITTTEKDPSFGSVKLVLSVLNRVHLARVMRRLRAINGVNKVVRPRYDRGSTGEQKASDTQ